jgi:hypothetical protein
VFVTDGVAHSLIELIQGRYVVRLQS